MVFEQKEIVVQICLLSFVTLDLLPGDSQHICILKALKSPAGRKNYFNLFDHGLSPHFSKINTCSIS